MLHCVPTVRRDGAFADREVLAAFFPEGDPAPVGRGFRLAVGTIPCCYQLSVAEQPQRRPAAFYGVVNASVQLEVYAEQQSIIYLYAGAILSGFGVEALAYAQPRIGPIVVPAQTPTAILLPTWASNTHRAGNVRAMVEFFASFPVTVSGRYSLVCSDPVVSELEREYPQLIDPIT